jgi:Leucine rich repeat
VVGCGTQTGCFYFDDDNSNTNYNSECDIMQHMITDNVISVLSSRSQAQERRQPRPEPTASARSTQNESLSQSLSLSLCEMDLKYQNINDRLCESTAGISSLDLDLPQNQRSQSVTVTGTVDSSESHSRSGARLVDLLLAQMREWIVEELDYHSSNCSNGPISGESVTVNDSQDTVSQHDYMPPSDSDSLSMTAINTCNVELRSEAATHMPTITNPYTLPVPVPPPIVLPAPPPPCTSDSAVASTCTLSAHTECADTTPTAGLTLQIGTIEPLQGDVFDMIAHLPGELKSLLMIQCSSRMTAALMQVLIGDGSIPELHYVPGYIGSKFPKLLPELLLHAAPNCCNLHSIDLSKNTFVHDELVRHLIQANAHHLHSLKLEGCSRITDHVWHDIQQYVADSIEHLTLSMCNGIRLNMLSPQIRLPHLHTLHLSGCRKIANQLDAALLSCPTINELDISFCQLESLPESIGTLPLRYLNASGNVLSSTTFPASFRNLAPHLQHLNIRGNALSALPPCLFDCIHLKYLHVRTNHLTSISTSISKLQCLRLLDLSFNRLTSLPNSISDLQSLQALLCSYNHIAAFPILAPHVYIDSSFTSVHTQ